MWLIAILSSIPYTYITKKNESGCRFNVDMGFYFLIPFYVSTGLFFVLPVFILCFLYALMGRHLYSQNAFEVTRWKKSKLRFDKARHYSLSSEYRSEGSSACRRQSRPRLIASSAHVHPMKKSAFKMLCELFLLWFDSRKKFSITTVVIKESNKKIAKCKKSILLFNYSKIELS